ncbi:sigma-54-dependent Fis family transcriptional regulator [Desulfoglaeba alkanexedens ALDC]|uniref:Sigma-54-dependent Fis family transcriptional regulator n=2 Tax=Desulfoglaeba alkanexedens TaxID=361111 RepID=A0A4P8L067_9BACT|nr:sigma-54-dependent Fis family transcriptional regulator [Desulfoglaeba alkanexedens ALDC]
MAGIREGGEEETEMAKVLFVEDDASLRLTQTLYLEQEGFTVTAASGRRGARKSLEQDSFDLVVTDLRLGEASGIDVLRDTRSLQPEAEIIVITGYGSVESAVEAMKEGAYDYLTKPVDPEQLVRVLRKALERRALRLQVDHLQVRCAREAGLDGFVAVSPAMRLVLSAVDDVAATDATVLIEGESGTGKELIAKLIHQRSRRAMGPFLGINCGAMPENLLESELFGHVRGSFTGAHRDKKGLFEAAGGGTLFLDEIGELSPNFQVKLLRTLQEGTIRRVGDIRETFVDVRIIAASNRDLIGLVHEGAFRQDLYFRIKVVPIHLPPLRERREDILPLAEMFVRRLSDRMGRKPPELSPAAKEKLYGHCWPGNVRELENTLERALIFNRGDRLEADDFTLEACPPHPSAGFGTAAEDARDWRVSLEEIERRHILDVLERCGGNRTKAARILGIGTNTLWRKIKRYQEASGYDPTQT